MKANRITDPKNRVKKNLKAEFRNPILRDRFRYVFKRARFLQHDVAGSLFAMHFPDANRWGRFRFIKLILKCKNLFLSASSCLYNTAIALKS